MSLSSDAWCTLLQREDTDFGIFDDPTLNLLSLLAMFKVVLFFCLNTDLFLVQFEVSDTAVKEFLNAC